MLPVKKNVADKLLPANKQKGKKKCSCCGSEKSLIDFYSSANPLYSSDRRVPICKTCIRDLCIDKETKMIDEIKLNQVLKSVQKPYFKDDLESAYAQFSKEHSYVDNENIKTFGDKILGLYFKNTMLRQNKDLSYDDSEKMNFIHSNSNISKKIKEEISNKYSDIGTTQTKEDSNIENNTTEELIYSKEWKGSYTERDIENLNDYYTGLNRDYKIITANHRDYARKIAKASLQMDKCYENMLNGVDGADKKYKDAMTTFDTLSKSAKFSESTRSVNDVGISGFAKVSEIVEAHNWIPKHLPKEKDVIDEMLEYLSTITKSI